MAPVTLSQLSNVTLQNNTASVSGGTHLEQINITHLRNVTFSKNEALSGDGGALSFTYGQIDIEECTFQENVASGNGGVITGTDSMKVTILKGQFMKNKADQGGAIFIRETVFSQMNRTKFERNEAEKAGAVAVNQNVSIDLHNCEFTSNI